LPQVSTGRPRVVARDGRIPESGPFDMLIRMPSGVVLVLAAMAFAPVMARATTLVHLDTRALAQQSQEIVIGRVSSTHAHWNETHTRIVTDVDVDVSQSLKGAATTRVTLTQLGGEVDGVRVSVAGCAAFRPGEEALLFVWRDARGHAQLTGLAQGKFEIERDARTGEAYVQRAAPGFGVREVQRLSAVPSGVRAPRLRLADLVSEIRGNLAPAAGSGGR
jgi:hypothetical protein